MSDLVDNVIHIKERISYCTFYTKGQAPVLYARSVPLLALLPYDFKTPTGLSQGGLFLVRFADICAPLGTCKSDTPSLTSMIFRMTDKGR